jgi:hypothetical protein
VTLSPHAGQGNIVALAARPHLRKQTLYVNHNAIEKDCSVSH